MTIKDYITYIISSAMASEAELSEKHPDKIIMIGSNKGKNRSSATTIELQHMVDSHDEIIPVPNPQANTTYDKTIFPIYIELRGNAESENADTTNQKSKSKMPADSPNNFTTHTYKKTREQIRQEADAAELAYLLQQQKKNL